MNILYLDESGDHDLINIDPDYPIFVLAGSVIAKDYHNNNLTRRMNQFKQDIFSDNDIILHYADYTRNKSGFERMISKEFREKFYSGLNTIIQTTEVSVYACIIDKKRHVESYKYPINPYTYSLEVIVEKFVMDLNRANKQGMIIAESRGSQFDNELNLAYLNLKISGTRFLKASEVNNRIGNDFYIKKKGNYSGHFSQNPSNYLFYAPVKKNRKSNLILDLMNKCRYCIKYEDYNTRRSAGDLSCWPGNGC